MILMTVLVQPRKNLILILVKQRWNFAWVCITIMLIVVCLLTEKKSVKFKTGKRNVNFPAQCLYYHRIDSSKGIDPGKDVFLIIGSNFKIPFAIVVMI